MKMPLIVKRLSIAVAILIALGTTGWVAIDFVGRRHDAEIYGTKPVIFTLGTRTFTMPRNLFWSLPRRDHREGDANSKMNSFSINVLLPDFTARTAENSDIFNKPGWGDGRLLHIFVEYGGKFSNSDAFLAQKITNGEELSASILGDVNIIKIGYESYLFNGDMAHPKYIAFCNVVKSSKSPSCEREMIFDGGIRVKYSTAMNNFADLHTIDQKVVTLLNSTLVNGAKLETMP